MKKIETSIACPKCKRNFKVKIADMHPGNSKICPSCGSSIEFTGDDCRKTQKAFDDFEKDLKKMFK
jgi:rRNA maturation endonuclease Nob1